MFHVNSLDIQELVVGKGCILTHHTEVCTCFAIFGHHLVCRVYIQKCYRLFVTFFLCRKLLEHPHLERAENFSTRSSQSNQNMVSGAKTLLWHIIRVYIFIVLIYV